MAASVETMFYVRKRPRHGLGVEIQKTLSNAGTPKVTGLDWEVKQRDIQVCSSAEIGNYKANIRSTDGRMPDVISNHCQIMQNKDAFSFIDELIGGDVRYETADNSQNGKKAWLLAKMPEHKVVGNKVRPYLYFSSMHDESDSVRVCMTPIRAVCNNTLSLALNGMERQQATKHVGNTDEKIQEAHMCLQLADVCMDGLTIYADRLTNTTITDEQLDKLLDEMSPADNDGIGRKKNSVKEAKDEFMICYFRPDIVKLLDTGWSVVSAMSDMISHSVPYRQTSSYHESSWNRTMDGYKMLDCITELVCAR